VVFVIAGRPTNFEPLWVFGVAGGWTFALLMQLFDQGGQKATEQERLRGQSEHSLKAEVPGLSATEQVILRVLKRFSSNDGFYLAPELPAGGLYKARRSSRVPPAEPVLALLDFTGDEEDASQSLLFGSTGIYFHVENNGEEVTRAIPYADFGRRA